MKRMPPAAINAEASSVIRMLIMRCGANNLNRITVAIRRKVLDERRHGDTIEGRVDGRRP